MGRLLKVLLVAVLAFGVWMFSVVGDTGDRAWTLNVDDEFCVDPELKIDTVANNITFDFNNTAGDITWDYSVVTEGITWSDGVDTTATEDSNLVFVITTPSSKPYLSKDPNSGDWICLKHGNISPQGDWVIDMSTTNFVFSNGTVVSYCDECVWETVIIILNQYITGVEE